MPGGLNWTPLTVRFDGSLETKEDVRLSSPPDFDVLKDAHFEEIGALQTRLPFGAVMGSGAIFGGGALSNCRKLATVNGELCLMTDTGLYSWNAQLSQWVLRGTHLAVSVDETPRLATTGDQIDGDRAELNGTIVIAWTEGTQVYAGAVDKVTGSVLVSPTAVSSSVARPRLVALATKILLFVDAGSTTLTVRAIDPAAPATGIGGAGTTVNTAFNSYYDVVRAGSQDLVVGAFRRSTTTSYSVFTCTPALSVTLVTKARTADGPVAVSTIPDGTKTQIARANGTNIQGDLLTTSSLADVFTAQAIGTVASTPVNQIAAAHRSVQNGGQFRCYVFWHAQESNATCTWVSKSNWVDTNNTLGTEANFVRHLAVASRAFDYNGSVYVWLAFGGATTANLTGAFPIPPLSLQNTYFLYRDDAFLAAKSIGGEAGGFPPSTGNLPTVALTSGSTVFSWCGTKRRKIVLAKDGVGFAAREPVDVTFTFDSNAARRSTQLGATLYIAAGEILQYDGRQLVEVGFHVYPWILSIIDAAGGSKGVGTYGYKATLRWQSAVGETDRSTTATFAQIALTGGRASFVAPLAPLTATHKTAVPPALEIWGTAITPGEDAPFYLVTSNDPTALTNPNRYLPNDPTASSMPTFNDDLADSALTGKESNPENGTVLEFLVPPPAKIIVPTETRLLLAGVAGDPDAWWYSRERGDGEVASFHDELRVEVPPVGGAITALWADDQFVYVARQTAIYAYQGPGKANDDSGQNFTLVRTISRDVGVVSQDAHAQTPMGRLFKSSKGWYLLDGINSAPRYVGGAVASFDSDTVVAVTTITAKHQVRILSTSRLLVWDYRGLVDAMKPGAGRWAEHTISDGLDAVLWNGAYVYLTASGPKQEGASYTGLTYGLDAELSWIKPADLFGAVAVRKIQPLGEYRSAHLLRLRIAYNYDDTIIDDVIWNPSPTTVGGPLQFSHGPKRRNCQAFKVRLTAVAAGIQASLAMASGLSHVVSTSGTNWSATFAAKTGNYSVIGELGNQVTMSIAFASGSPNVIDVRDHFAYDPSTGLWSPDFDNVGVRVVCSAGSLTVAALEAAIVAGSALIQLSAGDATPTKTINAAGMAGLSVAGSFVGGTFTAPTGEALKLTGLGLEVGITSGGLYPRLPAAQKA